MSLDTGDNQSDSYLQAWGVSARDATSAAIYDFPNQRSNKLTFGQLDVAQQGLQYLITLNNRNPDQIGLQGQAVSEVIGDLVIAINWGLPAYSTMQAWLANPANAGAKQTQKDFSLGVSTWETTVKEIKQFNATKHASTQFTPQEAGALAKTAQAVLVVTGAAGALIGSFSGQGAGAATPSGKFYLGSPSTDSSVPVSVDPGGGLAAAETATQSGGRVGVDYSWLWILGGILLIMAATK